MIKSSGQGQDQTKVRSQKVTIHKNIRFRVVAHVLWVILHVEYGGDGFLVIRAHLGESRYKVRPKRSKFDIFNFGKQRHGSDAEYPQESNGAI